MTSQAHCFASAVVYVHNNASTVAQFITTLGQYLQDTFTAHEIICVNDASSDDSAQIIREVSRSINNGSITTIHFNHRLGPELAMQAGIELSIGDFVYEFDFATMNFSQSTLSNAYEKASEGYDIVGVSPDTKSKLSSRLFYRAMGPVGNSEDLMHTEAFRLLSRRAINRVKDMCQVTPYRKAVYASSGLRYATIFFSPSSTEKLRDKGYRTDTAINALLLFTRIGYRISIGLAFFMMAVALFMIIYSFVCYFAGITISGWMTTILFLSFAFLGLFGILAIVIKYLQLIVNLTFKKKSFSYESIERY